ncbi:uncharacterized protein LOC110677715 isoform X2 [Aedes aegypti]|uniref:Uncharacterized protein n=1 Tax=Aedes aegypti TaxID=7159 RepID=A0A6I8TSQ4_AEDAE|nr:uncharacterized protein LOC110677715 isoform X2 [Aedes aegypti]
MVFSSYSNASYLPLDSDQGVTFYKNENLLFAPAPAAASPTALVCRRNNPVAAAMLSTSTGSSPFSGQPLLHGNRQHHGSSNGYYGYVPPANPMPKLMSTEQAAGTTPPAAVDAHRVINGSNGVGGVLLDSSTRPVAVDDSYSMDCGGMAQVENYQQQQHQQHLRKRKECSEEVEANCKRRKTWLEQPNDAGFVHSPNWNQSSTQQMDCQDQPMDIFSPQPQFHQSPITMNAPTTIAFNGFQHHPELQQQQQTMISTPPMPAAPQQHTILQPKNRLFRASSPIPKMSLGSSELAVADKQSIHQLRHNHRPILGDDCQQLEDLFISLHGSGFYLAC